MICKFGTLLLNLDKKLSMLGQLNYQKFKSRGQFQRWSWSSRFSSELFQVPHRSPDNRKWDLESRKRRIKSISQVAVFLSTSRIKKPSKHLQLGLAIKSLTGSRKVVDILNRMGHCVRNFTVEELETELTFEDNKNSKETPLGMKTTPQFNTGIA